MDRIINKKRFIGITLTKMRLNHWKDEILWMNHADQHTAKFGKTEKTGQQVAFIFYKQNRLIYFAYNRISQLFFHCRTITISFSKVFE